MFKEWEFAGRLVEHFASYHRQSYACKAGVGDVLIGAAQTAAQYNGVARASHVKDKLIEMNHLNETLFCGSVACAAQGGKEPSGTYLVDTLLANVCKQNVTRFPYEISRLAQDIAGGLMVTMPSEADLRSPEVGHWVTKYFKANPEVSTENRMRILRLIENLTLGTAAVGYLTESMHGAGSPQAQRIMIARQVNMAQKQKVAKELGGHRGGVGLVLLGLKYCGGCSPDYDRGEQVRRLTQKLDGLVEMVFPEDPRVEHVLVVMGCKNACADIRSLAGRKLYLVHGEAEFNDIITTLFEIAKGAN